MLRMLELFSGSGVMSKAFQREGFETITLDNEPDYHPDICESIFDFDPYSDLHPDVIWASPPCTKFSVASLSRNWRDGKPINPETEEAIAIVRRTLDIIRIIKPRFYFIENPRGMLRTLDIMKGMPRMTISFCQYGENRMKPTDIWTNASMFFRCCKNGDPCHEAAPRGSKTGTQGIKGAYNRGILPTMLCDEVASYCKKGLYDKS